MTTVPRSPHHTMQTVRQKMVELLSRQELDARQLSEQLGIREKEVGAHLSHVARSLGAKGQKLTIRPAECLLCGYVFEIRRRYTRPGRCPRCKKSHLRSPGFYISAC